METIGSGAKILADSMYRTLRSWYRSFQNSGSVATRWGFRESVRYSAAVCFMGGCVNDSLGFIADVSDCGLTDPFWLIGILSNKITLPLEPSSKRRKILIEVLSF